MTDSQESQNIPWEASATLVGYGAANFKRTLLDCVRIWHGLPQNGQKAGLINVSQPVFGKSVLGPSDLARLARQLEFLAP